MAELSADEVTALLGLIPHPEGGAYRETWRDEPPDGSRGSGSAILFLLRAGEASAWHRVDATEIWHFHAGAAVELRTVSAHAREAPRRELLGPELDAGQRPQVVIPAEAWQSARSLGAWSLVGCTVSPAFTFDGFELASDTLAAQLGGAAAGQDGDGESLGGEPASSM